MKREEAYPYNALANVAEFPVADLLVDEAHVDESLLDSHARLGEPRPFAAGGSESRGRLLRQPRGPKRAGRSEGERPVR
jgi:hypothetical protein